MRENDDDGGGVDGLMAAVEIAFGGRSGGDGIGLDFGFLNLVG